MRKLSGVSVAVLALMLSSGAARAETVNDALVSAYSGSPVLQAQRAKLRASAEGISQAEANWRPVVKLSGDIGKTDIHSSSATPHDQSMTPRDAALSITQPLYRGGRTVAQTKQAEAQFASDSALFRSNEQTVLLNAAVAFSDVVQNQSVLELNRNNEQVLQRQLDAVRDRFQVGELTKTDVSQAESRLSGAHADRVQAEGLLAASEATYNNVIGHTPEPLQALPVPVPVPISLAEAQQQAGQFNPNIQAAEAAERAAQHGIDLVFGELLPQVSLTGTLSRGLETAAINSYNRTASAMLNVTIPLYQGGQDYSRLRQQKQTASQRRSDLATARRDITEQTTRAWESLTAAVASKRQRSIAITAPLRRC